MSEYVPKLVHLPGTAVSPELVLHRTLDKLEHIKSVTITIQWHNDELATDWSQMRVSELCMHSMNLEEQVKKTMYDGENL
jgi:hypothetical protein